MLVAGALTSTRRSTRFTVLEAIRAGSVSLPDSRLARAVVRSVMPLTVGLGLKDLDFERTRDQARERARRLQGMLTTLRELEQPEYPGGKAPSGG